MYSQKFKYLKLSTSGLSESFLISAGWPLQLLEFLILISAALLEQFLLIVTSIALLEFLLILASFLLEFLLLFLLTTSGSFEGLMWTGAFCAAGFVKAIETGIILLVDQVAAVIFVKLTKVSDQFTKLYTSLHCYVPGAEKWNLIFDQGSFSKSLIIVHNK